MPIVYVVDKPAPVGYIQWTGDNLQEFADYFGNMFSVEAMENGNLKLTNPQQPSMTRQFLPGTWIAGYNVYMADETKSTMKQEVPGPNVKYLTEETP